MATARRQLGYVSSLTQQAVPAAASLVPTLYEFTTTGTTNWTVPAGVTYVIANITGAGAGSNVGATLGGAGGNSSVAFSSGTITANGGSGGTTTNATITGSGTVQNKAGVRYGEGAWARTYGGSNSTVAHMVANNGAYLRAGGAVTPGNTLAITVGAGGTAGTNGAAGAQGVVVLEAWAGNARRCELFTTTGTFNPPAGVTSVNATLIGGGGGCGAGDWNGGTGGNTTINFSSGTVTATGGFSTDVGRFGFEEFQYYPTPTNNSGRGGILAFAGTTTRVASNFRGGDGQIQVVQRTVSFGSGLTVTIGAGGSGEAGTFRSAAGSGVAWIEYSV